MGPGPFEQLDVLVLDLVDQHVQELFVFERMPGVFGPLLSGCDPSLQLQELVDRDLHFIETSPQRDTLRGFRIDLAENFAPQAMESSSGGGNGVGVPRLNAADDVAILVHKLLADLANAVDNTLHPPFKLLHFDGEGVWSESFSAIYILDVVEMLPQIVEPIIPDAAIHFKLIHRLAAL